MLDGVLFFPVTPFSPFEVACLDVQGKLLGRPVSDLLGGAVRDSVPFSAYLFYKWGWLGSPGWWQRLISSWVTGARCIFTTPARVSATGALPRRGGSGPGIPQPRG
jgi:L-alanine-DL-glutamate epimerase-like enolase superfamily enzyme